MEALGYVIATLVSLAVAAAFFAVFVWAARKDGDEDLAVQRRLGFRRKTRLGL
jgi:hypothetical protein